MKNFPTATVRTLTVLSIVAVFLLAVSIIPGLFSSAGDNQAASIPETNETAERGFPNFDIRTDKSAASADALVQIRGKLGRDASSIATLREDIVRGEDDLRSRIPGVVVEYNDRLGAAEVIAPDVWKNDSQLLSEPGSGSRPDRLKGFLRENASLVGVDPSQTDALKVAADYTNPDGNLSYTHLEQSINGVPVFAGEVKAGFDRDGRIIRVINNLAPGLDYRAVPKDFGDPADALRAAAGHIDHALTDSDLRVNAKASTEFTKVFGTGDWATTVERMYFPTEPGVAIPAWRVLIWEPVDAYYVIVDAE